MHRIIIGIITNNYDDSAVLSIFHHEKYVRTVGLITVLQ